MIESQMKPALKNGPENDGGPGLPGSDAIVFSNVSMTFPDGTEALKDIDLSVRSGEFVSIVGPSGCGKSTLLRIASGLSTHTAGDIWVDRQRLGYTFQDPTLLPWRPVSENVELLMELRDYPLSARKQIAAEKIALVGLTGFENHYPKRLSGGMRMRASLARSLSLNPKVFMFDEPFGALDEITRERLNDEVRAHYRREGFTGLFVTHSIAEAVYMSTRVVVMSRRPGRIIETVDINLGDERSAELRYEPEFARLCGLVSRALRHAIED